MGADQGLATKHTSICSFLTYILRKCFIMTKVQLFHCNPKVEKKCCISKVSRPMGLLFVFLPCMCCPQGPNGQVLVHKYLINATVICKEEYVSGSPWLFVQAIISWPFAMEITPEQAFLLVCPSVCMYVNLTIDFRLCKHFLSLVSCQAQLPRATGSL